MAGNAECPNTRIHFLFSLYSNPYQAGLKGGTTTHCAGVLGADPARGPIHDRNHVGDLDIFGLCTSCQYLIANVTIVLPWLALEQRRGSRSRGARRTPRVRPWGTRR
jgi:hypothetical protein